MKFTSCLLAILAVLCVVLAEPSVCQQHPMRDHVMKSISITNRGLACFFDKESECFTQLENDLKTFYVDTPVAVAEGHQVICEKIENHCLLEEEIDTIKGVFDTFITAYRDVIADLFAYDVENDTTVNDILVKIADAIKGISDLIPADVVDKLVPQAKEALVDVFTDLKKEAEKLSEYYEPTLNALEEYSAGLYCFSADADYMKFYDEAAQGVLVSVDAFENIAASFTAFRDEHITEFVTNTQKKLLEFWNSFTNTGNAFIDGIIDNILGLENYLKNEFTADKLFFRGDVDGFQDCFFPEEGKPACVPFVDDIMLLIERFKRLFNGDFDGFMAKEISVQSIDADLLEMRQRVLSSTSVLSETSSALPIIWSNSGTAYSILETAKNAPEELQPTTPKSPSSSNNDESSEKLFGFDPILVYAAIGGLVVLVWITCLVACCCRSKPSNPYQNMGFQQMPSAGMGTYASVNGGTQPMYM